MTFYDIWGKNDQKGLTNNSSINTLTVTYITKIPKRDKHMSTCLTIIHNIIYFHIRFIKNRVIH